MKQLFLGYCKIIFQINFIPIGLVCRVFTNGPTDRISNPRRVIPKTQKIVLAASLLSTQYHKVWIKGKVEQSRERGSALSVEKGAFESPSIMVTNFISVIIISPNFKINRHQSLSEIRRTYFIYCYQSGNSAVVLSCNNFSLLVAGVRWDEWNVVGGKKSKILEETVPKRTKTTSSHVASTFFFFFFFFFTASTAFETERSEREQNDKSSLR